MLGAHGPASLIRTSWKSPSRIHPRARAGQAICIGVLAALMALSPPRGVEAREYVQGMSSHYSHCPFLDGIYTSVMRRIFNPGLHKALLSEIEVMLTTSILPDVCQLVVEETLPSGMYVDTDELRDLAEAKGLRTFVPVPVDVEKPEFQADAFRMYVFRDLQIQENLRLTQVEVPVHLRYHTPRPPTPDEERRGLAPSAIVKLQNPRLFLSCRGDHLAQHCPDRTVTSYCDASGTSKCEYLHLPYKINVNAVEVSVPVGNEDHGSTVVGITTFIVSGGTIYLIIALLRAPEIKVKID